MVHKNLVKVGKLTGANVIISGSYQIVNNEIVVNSRYIDVEKGTVESGGAFYIRGDVNKIFDVTGIIRIINCTSLHPGHDIINKKKAEQQKCECNQ